MSNHWLTDDQWERIRDHFPEENIADGRPGRKPTPTRCVLEPWSTTYRISSVGRERSTYHPAADAPNKAPSGKALRRTAGARCDARTDSLSTNFRREGLIPATSWRVLYKSFSASSRNSSGTHREGPNTNVPYPTAYHPKRLRIMSTARSAVQRAIPLSVPGLRFSSSQRKFQLHLPVLLKMRHGDRQQRYGLLLRVIGKRRTNESSAISARVAVAQIGASSLAAFSKCGALEFRTFLRSA